MPEIVITADARRMARGHALEGDDAFLAAIGTAIEMLGDAARREDVFAEATALRIRQERAGRIEAEDAARKEGAAAERTRIKSILTAREAEGREAVARSLAFNSELPAAAAIEALKSAPVASPGPAAAPTTPADRAAVAAALAAAGIKRTEDAPGEGGLLCVDGTYATVSSFEPTPAGSGGAKALWKKAVADLNSEVAARAEPAAQSAR